MSFSNNPKEYHFGQKVRCEGLFKNRVGNPVDPDEVVRFQVKGPEGELTEYVYGTDPELVRQQVGVFYALVDANTVGWWYYRFWTTGDAQSAKERAFRVLRSEFEVVDE